MELCVNCTQKSVLQRTKKTRISLLDQRISITSITIVSTYLKTPTTAVNWRSITNRVSKPRVSKTCGEMTKLGSRTAKPKTPTITGNERILHLERLTSILVMRKVSVNSPDVRFTPTSSTQGKFLKTLTITTFRVILTSRKSRITICIAGMGLGNL